MVVDVVVVWEYESWARQRTMAQIVEIIVGVVVVVV